MDDEEQGANDEGEEEAEGEDDEITEVSANPSSSVHMSRKRARLAEMMSEIAELERKITS